ALTFFDNIRKFDLMSRYVARLSRLIIQNHNQLTSLQAARYDADRESQMSELRRETLSFERDMHTLEERVREVQPAPRPQNPAANSGFVSQRPAQPTATGPRKSETESAKASDPSVQTQNPLERDPKFPLNRAA
ncbi:MAG: hypothetical protein ABI823_18365, partial [Bryobacteraceae bacterium]